MDSLDIVHKISGKSGQSLWILWTKSREPTQTGQCQFTQKYSPLSPWTMSMGLVESLDNVHGYSRQSPGSPLRLANFHGLIGYCPPSPWRMSMDSLDFIHGLSLSGKCGHCPLIYWTMSRQTIRCPLNPWAPLTLSIDKVHSLC